MLILIKAGRCLLARLVLVDDAGGCNSCYSNRLADFFVMR
jgi:hypothetical protein